MQTIERRTFWVFLLTRGLYYTLILLGILVYFAANFIELAVSKFSGFVALMAIGVVFAFVVSGIWAWLYTNMYSYDITSDGVQVQSGVIFRKFTTIPFQRIQNVDLYQGPVLTIFGLREVRIQTAGSSMPQRWGRAEGTITGLTPEKAATVRQQLVSKTKGNSGV